MWTFTLASDVYGNLPEPVEMGWKMENNKYKIQWEDEDREREIRQNLLFLTKGCMQLYKRVQNWFVWMRQKKEDCMSNEDKVSNEKEEDSNVEDIVVSVARRRRRIVMRRQRRIVMRRRGRIVMKN